LKVVPDTNVWIEWLSRHGMNREEWDVTSAEVLVSTIVLQELWAGARNERELVDLGGIYELARRRRTLANPPPAAWVMSGEALRELGKRRSIGAARLRSLRNDALLAATAVADDATVLTHNKRDFELLADVLPVSFRVA